MPVITLHHDIPRTTEESYSFFSDLHKFVEVHPVIFRCDKLSGNEYELFEHFSMGLFKIPFSYKVVLEKVTPHQQVIMFSEIRKGVQLRLTFDFAANGTSTKITETVHFEGLGPGNVLFLKFLALQHRRLVRNIAALRK